MWIPKITIKTIKKIEYITITKNNKTNRIINKLIIKTIRNNPITVKIKEYKITNIPTIIKKK